MGQLPTLFPLMENIQLSVQNKTQLQKFMKQTGLILQVNGNQFGNQKSKVNKFQHQAGPQKIDFQQGHSIEVFQFGISKTINGKKIQLLSKTKEQLQPENGPKMEKNSQLEEATPEPSQAIMIKSMISGKPIDYNLANPLQFPSPSTPQEKQLVLEAQIILSIQLLVIPPKQMQITIIKELSVIQKLKMSVFSVFQKVLAGQRLQFLPLKEIKLLLQPMEVMLLPQIQMEKKLKKNKQAEQINYLINNQIYK